MTSRTVLSNPAVHKKRQNLEQIMSKFITFLNFSHIPFTYVNLIFLQVIFEIPL